MGRPKQSLRREVRTLLKSGRVYRGRLVHVRAGASRNTQILISVRRKFGGAVKRNKVRRRIRAICRLLGLSDVRGALVLITVSDRAGTATYQDLLQELTTAVQKLALV